MLSEKRVDQGRTRQPGHERGVLHRIPEPPAAPAQRVERPPAAQRDAQGQEAPGDVGPWPRPAQPARVYAAFQQRRHRERERYREADIAQVQHRRMDDQPRVLQQRIEVAAFQWHRIQAQERVGGEDQEGEEADADHTHHRHANTSAHISSEPSCAPHTAE
ncbi:hypothetical protein G6F50_015619 [Rhizopus delemar]|uniref:Uncharacterized protein n=1 Tax=Rhizopus delemar TaxID=936053 RepID=A0A9P6XXQ1_9FUNG|nr:hypothetical protein G6F50_015619 [Rhizopus delemar]